MTVLSIATATPCNPKDTDDQSRCLMGKLNIPDAIEFLLGETMSEELELETVEASGCGCGWQSRGYCTP
jgi:hypothetical protein